MRFEKSNFLLASVILVKSFDECDLVSLEVLNLEKTSVIFVCGLLEDKPFEIFDSRFPQTAKMCQVMN